MDFKEVKQQISEKLGWKCTDVFYLCTDQNLFDYYIVYKNHRIKNVVSIDKLSKCVSGIWD